MTKLTVAERIAAKAERRANGCLIWTGYLNEKGYGIIRIGGRTGTSTGVHIVAWEEANGPVPDGMQVDHFTCYTPACCEPSHLRLATRSQNSQNRKGPNKGSRTGIRGVYPSGEKYRVVVTAHGRQHYAGIFPTLVQASAAAETLRQKLHDPVPSIGDAKE